MELKSKLLKPYTGEEKLKFIVEQNHRNGYEIKETPEALEAWGKTDDELLAEAKKAKYDEANNGAKAYLDSGEALFELEPTKHIEATDGNIGKLSAYALGFVTGTLTEPVLWNTKEDEVIELNQEQLMLVLQGLGTVQAVVWNFKFPYFLQLIEEAQTVDDVNNIKIDYNIDIEVEDDEDIQDNDDTTNKTADEETGTAKETAVQGE